MTEKSNNPSKKSKSNEEVKSRKKLLRSPEDRVLTGVAGGIGTYLDVDPIIVRIGFVVSLFFGGLGAIAYLLFAAFVPEDDGTGNPVAGSRPEVLKVLAIVALVAAGIVASLTLATLSVWTTATGHGTIIAGLVIAAGIGVIAAATLNSRAVLPWLIGGALVLGVPAGAAAAADIRFDGGIGEREYKPLTSAELPADGYELGIGQLVVDLRDLDWKPGETVDLKSKLGIGQMVVSVPENVCVQADARAKGGDVVVRGTGTGGVDAVSDQTRPAGKAPRLELDADIQFGQIVVTDRDPDDVTNGRGPHNEGTDDPAEQDRADAACAA